VVHADVIEPAVAPVIFLDEIVEMGAKQIEVRIVVGLRRDVRGLVRMFQRVGQPLAAGDDQAPDDVGMRLGIFGGRDHHGLHHARVHGVAHHEQRLHQLLVLRENQFVGEAGIDRAAADGGEVGAEIAGRHQFHLLLGDAVGLQRHQDHHVAHRSRRCIGNLLADQVLDTSQG
jgi:hypothetical protein